MKTGSVHLGCLVSAHLAFLFTIINYAITALIIDSLHGPGRLRVFIQRKR
jgi:hypothetical protein